MRILEQNSIFTISWMWFCIQLLLINFIFCIKTETPWTCPLYRIVSLCKPAVEGVVSQPDWRRWKERKRENTAFASRYSFLCHVCFVLQRYSHWRYVLGVKKYIWSWFHARLKKCTLFELHVHIGVYVQFCNVFWYVQSGPSHPCLHTCKKTITKTEKEIEMEYHKAYMYIQTRVVKIAMSTVIP